MNCLFLGTADSNIQYAIPLNDENLTSLLRIQGSMSPRLMTTSVHYRTKDDSLVFTRGKRVYVRSLSENKLLHEFMVTSLLL